MSALVLLFVSAVYAGEDTFPLDDSGAFRSLEASDTDTDADDSDDVDTDASTDTYPTGGAGVAELTGEKGGCACTSTPASSGIAGALGGLLIAGAGLARRRS